MIKVFVESLRARNEGRMHGVWIEIPNEDLDAAIHDIFGEDNYEFTDYECDFGLNVLDYDVCELNDLLMYIEHTKKLRLDKKEDCIVLKLLIEYLSNLDNVEYTIRHDSYSIFRNVKDMGDVAIIHLEENSLWYPEVKEAFSLFDGYFDFKSYGEEILNSSNSFIIDEENKIIVEVYE